MGPRGGGRGELSRRGDAALLAACARLYGTLLVLYPKAFRHRYGAEMRRDFRELSREGLAEGGAKGLVGVLALGLSDLAVTALAERSTAAARRGAQPLSVDLRMAARAMAAALLAAAVVTVMSLVQTPVYEASAVLLVGQKEQSDGKKYPMPNAPTPESLQQLTRTMVVAIESRPVAEGAIQRRGLQMGPQDFLDHLTVEQIEDSSFLRLSYTDTDPRKAQVAVNAVGRVSSERVSVTSGATDMTATLFDKASGPSAPASPKPLRNGLIALVVALVLCAGLALALPGPSAASVAGGLGGRAVRRAGAPAAAPASSPGVAGGIKEKELLRALGRRGKLTALGAALETSLTVEEADQTLSALAAKGHLEISVEHGTLLYSLWEGDAPP